MCGGEIVLSKLQAVVLIFDRMAFHLSGKEVALHLDNSTACLCYKGSTISFSFQTSLSHFKSG